MSRAYFDDDNTPKGIEGWYEIKSDTLVVFVNPTSKGLDWLIDFAGFPVPVELANLKLGWCHAGFKPYAYWLTGVIHEILFDHPEVKEVVLSGFSMGGGIAQLTAVICAGWMADLAKFRVVSIDGPRTTTKLPEGVLYRNAGSLVGNIPPWFKKLPEVLLNKKWNWFWKSHADYNIEELI